MHIAFLKESIASEARVAVLPETVKKLTALQAEISIESNIGTALEIADNQYEEAGGRINSDRNTLLTEADLLASVQKPNLNDIPHLKKGATCISFINPNNDAIILSKLAEQNINTISMDMIPHTTLAQKMDAISSQANISGYAAIVFGAQHLKTILPMMITPSGTITPARTLIIGAGVAGLQAIATAKRLGAYVEAFDTRPAAQEQIISLGAKCIKINMPHTDEKKYGYAAQLTDTQLKQQQTAMEKALIQADLIVTTAKVFGKPAPRLITQAMMQCMKPGSVIVDMAVDTGGNVEGSKLNEVVEINHVKIIGIHPLCNLFPMTASEMYANNIYHFINQFWNKTSKCFELNLDNEIIQNCLITHQGKLLKSMGDTHAK